MTRHGLAGMAVAAALLTGSTAMAQTTLRVGLAEDPDILDPTLARTYVGRIVFASLCDKLFDIDENINIVPQLALSHETSEDGKTVTIKLRPGVKFHDGETMDAEAVKASLERHMTMQGSFRRPELAAVDKVEVADPLTVRLLLKAPFSPLIAQLTDRAGMIVSPKADQGDGRQVRSEAGLRRRLQVRRARAAGPHRAGEIRRLLERGQHPRRPRGVPADRRVHGAARQSEIRQPRDDRAGAGDRPAGDQGRREAQAGDRARARLPGRHGQRRQWRCGQDRLRQGPAHHPGVQSVARPRGDHQGRLQRRVPAGQPVGQPEEPLLSEQVPGSQARCRQGQGAAEGRRRDGAAHRRFHGAEQSREHGRLPRSSRRWPARQASTSRSG